MQLRLQKRAAARERERERGERVRETHPRIIRIYVIFILGRQCIHTEKDMQKYIATCSILLKPSKCLTKKYLKINNRILNSILSFTQNNPHLQFDNCKLHSNWINIVKGAGIASGFPSLIERKSAALSLSLSLPHTIAKIFKYIFKEANLKL